MSGARFEASCFRQAPGLRGTPRDDGCGEREGARRQQQTCYLGVFKIGSKEFSLHRWEEKLLDRGELGCRKAYYLCEVLDILRAPPSRCPGFFVASNLQRVARVALDFVTITQDVHLLDSALEVTTTIVGLVGCCAEEPATEVLGFLLKRAWYNLQTADAGESNRTTVLMKLCKCLMSALARKDPLGIVLATQAASQNATFVVKILDSLVDRSASATFVETALAVLRHLWDCHTQYSGASFLKSFLYEHASRIHALLLLCHLTKEATDSAKVLCSDFVLDLLEQSPLKFDLDHVPEIAHAAGFGYDYNRGSSTWDLLLLVTKDALLHPEAKLSSNGMRLAQFVVGTVAQDQGRRSVDKDFLDHVINVVRGQALAWSKGDSARNQNLKDVAGIASIGTLHDICSFCMTPSVATDPCLHRAIDACILWLRLDVGDFFDASLSLQLYEIVLVCLGKMAHPLQPSSLRGLLDVAEGTVMSPTENETTQLAKSKAILGIFDGVLNMISVGCKGEEIVLSRGEGDDGTRGDQILPHICNLMLSVLGQFANERLPASQNSYSASQDDTIVQCLVSGMSALGTMHKLCCRIMATPGAPDVGPCLEAVLSGFDELLVPLLQPYMCSNHGGGALAMDFAFAVLGLFDGAREERKHTPAHLKSLSFKIFTSNLIFLLLGLPPLRDDTKGAIAMLISQLVQAVTGTYLTGRGFAAHLSQSQTPLTTMLRGILDKESDQTLCGTLEDGLALITCVLYHKSNTGEAKELENVLVMVRDTLKCHTKITLHCKAILGFLGTDLHRSSPIGTLTQDELRNAMAKMTPVSRVGLLAWLSKQKHYDSQDMDAILMCIIGIAHSVPFVRLFEYSTTDDLVRLARATLGKVQMEHGRLEPTKIMSVLTYVRELTMIPNFRECLFSEMFLDQVLGILKLVQSKEEKLASLSYKDDKDLITREAFYLVFACLDSDGQESRSDRSERSSCWLPFLVGIQGILIPRAKEGGGGEPTDTGLPLCLLVSLLSKVLSTNEMVRELQLLVRFCLNSSAKSMSADESPDIPLPSAILFLERVASIEKERIENHERSEQGLLEQTQAPGNGERAADDIWCSFEFVKSISSIAALTQNTRLGGYHRELLSLTSSLFAIWSFRRTNKIEEAVLSLSDEVVSNIFSFLCFAHGRVSKPGGGLPDKLMALECIYNLVSTNVIHKSVRIKLLYYPWNEPVFQGAVSFYNGWPGSMAFSLCRTLLCILRVYNTIGLPKPPPWLRRFIFRNHHLMMIAINNLEDKGETQSFTETLAELTRQ